MFRNCQNLNRIYISDGIENKMLPQKSLNMFLNCKMLTGGSGTKYDPTFIDATAARIDGGTDAPGYFTDIKDKAAESVADQVSNSDVPIEIPTVEEATVKEDNTDRQVETAIPVPTTIPTTDDSKKEIIEESEG